MLAKYIADRRHFLRLTQEEVAERLRAQGINRVSATIANWETGRQAIPLEVIPALANALVELTPVRMYRLAGVLDNLPGSEIIEMLDGLPADKIARAVRIIRAFVGDD